MALSNFPSAIAALLQGGYLVREMEEGLDSVLAYRGLAISETFPGRIGETMTRTRKGRRVPTTSPLSASGLSNTDLNNGMTVPSGSAFAIEQYTATLAPYGQTLDLNLMQEQVGIADQFIANARNNGVSAAQSLERICRLKLFSAYLGGNTRVITNPGATDLSTAGTANSGSTADAAVANVNVDDTRGFTTVLVNGVPTSISSTNFLPATVVSAAGVSYAVQIQTAVAYTYTTGKSASSFSTTPDAVPGLLTIKNVSGGAWVPTAGDALVANTAAVIFRTGGKRTQCDLAGGDLLTLGIIQDAVAFLRDNGVPPMPDGSFWCILDNTSMRQLYADSDFKNLFAGRADTPEFKNQDVVRLGGVTFIPTTEAYVQLQQTTVTVDPPNTSGGIKIRRPIVCGAECIIQCDFEGMESWLTEAGFDRNDSNIVMINGVLQIVREPLDRLQQVVAMSWHWIGDFAVPTDITSDNTIIPTASAVLYKRCAVIEHAG